MQYSLFFLCRRSPYYWY